LSGQRDCVFVQGRPCPFPSQQIPLQTCQVCVDAWKTEVALKSRDSEQPLQAIAATGGGPGAESRETVSRLNELDRLFKDDNLDPVEYVRLRKKQTERLADGDRPRLSLDKLGEAEAPAAEPRGTRVALIVKSPLGKRVHTHPKDWELPAAINDGVIDQILRLAKTGPAGEIRVGVAGYKVACVKHAKGKLLLLVLDGDEDFQTYEAEVSRLAELFQGEQHWVKTLREMGG